jgi:hypothetical protein
MKLMQMGSSPKKTVGERGIEKLIERSGEDFSKYTYDDLDMNQRFGSDFYEENPFLRR